MIDGRSVLGIYRTIGQAGNSMTEDEDGLEDLLAGWRSGSPWSTGST